MMRENTRLITYTAAHLLTDFGCAFFVFSAEISANESVIFLILYNFCAFALQMPLGLVADKLNRNAPLASAGLLLIAICPILMTQPLLMAVVAGVGNALFHVGGGLDVLNDCKQKSGRLGVFVSSGALGLFLGAMAAKAVPSFLVSLILVVTAVMVLLLCGEAKRAFLSDNAPLEAQRLSVGAILRVVLLLTVVVLRSYVGTIAAFEWKQGLWAWIAISAVVLGKAAGGFTADRVGLKATAMVSLGAAAVLFLFSDRALLGSAALLLFNMTMPITLFEIARILRFMKGFSFGLLTFGLFLGVLPGILGMEAPLATPWGLAFLTLLSLVLLIFGLKGEGKHGAVS
ncbi:MAG: hypothetical protein Q4C01_00700 [Clostridia bacterium]|nr:hypothetical protein [Clostridia bacterium]